MMQTLNAASRDNEIYIPSRIKWEDVKVVVLDLDGVFYPETQEFHNNVNFFMSGALIQLASQRGIDLSGKQQDLMDIGFDGYDKKGHSFNGLQPWLDKNYPGKFDLLGADWEYMHHLIHDMHIAHAGTIPGYFESCEERRKFFESLCSFENYVILTHGSKNWARGVVQALDIDHHFEDSQIYGLECVDFNRKDKGPEPFEKICRDLNVAPGNVLFIDNTMKNHIFPSRLGMQTLWIQGDRENPEKLPEYVSDQAHDLAQVAVSRKNWETGEDISIPPPKNDNF